MEKTIIVGAGPAGLTAAIYSARANLQPLCIEGFQAGGQLMTTTDVENYPGFPKGIMGPELMQLFRQQAERFGTRFITDNATRLELNGHEKKVWVGDKSYSAQSIIISTGAKANLLGLPSEQRLMGHGVSTCATCDGFFFRNQVITVVGGGDSAMEEANFLSRFGSKVYLIHRRHEFRASKIMLERCRNNPKIEFIMDTVVEEVLGEKEVSALRLKNLLTQKTSELPCAALFVAIGHTPNVDLLQGQITLDDKGYIQTGTHPHFSSQTNLPGVFACGDVQDHVYRQAITAAGSGCSAAIDCERYLEEIA